MDEIGDLREILDWLGNIFVELLFGMREPVKESSMLTLNHFVWWVDDVREDLDQTWFHNFNFALELTELEVVCLHYLLELSNWDKIIHGIDSVGFVSYT